MKTRLKTLSPGQCFECGVPLMGFKGRDYFMFCNGRESLVEKFFCCKRCTPIVLRRRGGTFTLVMERPRSVRKAADEAAPVRDGSQEGQQ